MPFPVGKLAVIPAIVVYARRGSIVEETRWRKGRDVRVRAEKLALCTSVGEAKAPQNNGSSFLSPLALAARFHARAVFCVVQPVALLAAEEAQRTEAQSCKTVWCSLVSM